MDGGEGSTPGLAIGKLLFLPEEVIFLFFEVVV